MENIIFSLEMTNGYVFRQIFELYDKLIVNRIPIFFKESGVTIRASVSSSKDGQKLVSDVEIFTEDVINYYINTELTNLNKENSQLSCQLEKIQLSNIKNVLKSVSKSNSVRLYKEKDCENINVQIKGINIDNAQITSNISQSCDYTVTGFDDLSDVPNVKIDIGQFCGIMKSILRDSNNMSEFKIYKRGLVIESKNSTGTVIKSNTWGDLEGEYNTCMIGSNFIKALCKVNSLANYSIVKIYCNRDNHLKISHKVGDFGEHNIFITKTV